MKLTAFQIEILDIVQSANPNFLTPYQICNSLKEIYPTVWKQLTSAYPSGQNKPQMGAGADKPYSPATYVAQALEHFRKNGSPVRKENFSCENVIFNGTKPGFTGNVVSIWAWQ